MYSCASLSYVLTRMSFQVHEHLEWKTFPCHKLKQAFIYFTVKQTTSFKLTLQWVPEIRCHSSEIYKLWLTKCCIAVTFYFWKNGKHKATVSKKIRNSLHNKLSAVLLYIWQSFIWLSVYTLVQHLFSEYTLLRNPACYLKIKCLYLESKPKETSFQSPPTSNEKYTQQKYHFHVGSQTHVTRTN